MKFSKLLTFLLVTLMTTFCNDKKHANIEIENNTIKFIIKRGEIFIADFKLKNTGNSTLLIKSINSTCGCTQVGKIKYNINPGEEQVVKIKYDNKADMNARKIKKAIMIESNTTPILHTVYIEGEAI